MAKISVGIAALNEEQNIKKLLITILGQDLGTNELIEILVVSDGSTDGTGEEVKTITDTRIKLIEYKERAGKMQRFNEIFKKAKGDIVISIDADVLPENTKTFFHLLERFNENGVEFVSGRSLPLPPRNFLEKSINISRMAWDTFRDTLKDGNGVYACNGKFYAITQKLASELTFPETGTEDQGYIYFFCLKEKYKVRGCKEAKILFRSPNNIREHVKQIKRYQGNVGLTDEFGEIVDKEYAIPTDLLRKEKMKLFIKYPAHCLFLAIINYYAKNIYNPVAKTDQKWEIQSSTKEAIAHEN